MPWVKSHYSPRSQDRRAHHLQSYDGCIPLLPLELWYQSAVHWFRRALWGTKTSARSHICWVADCTFASWHERDHALQNDRHTSVWLPLGFPVSHKAASGNVTVGTLFQLWAITKVSSAIWAAVALKACFFLLLLSDNRNNKHVNVKDHTVNWLDYTWFNWLWRAGGAKGKLNEPVTSYWALKPCSRVKC